MRLATPRGERTRPTSERVREAVFSSLASWAGSGDQPPQAQMSGLAFLDLYAGSGAVGLEAASRGACRVVLVESHAATARLIAQNVQTVTGALWPAPAIEVATRDVSVFLGQPGQPHDVVWLDPPYGEPIEAVLQRIVEGGWLVEDGLLIAERSSRDGPPAWPAALSLTWRKDYGDTVIHYARRPTTMEV